MCVSELYSKVYHDQHREEFERRELCEYSDGRRPCNRHTIHNLPDVHVQTSSENQSPPDFRKTQNGVWVRIRSKGRSGGTFRDTLSRHLSRRETRPWRETDSGTTTVVDYSDPIEEPIYEERRPRGYAPPPMAPDPPSRIPRLNTDVGGRRRPVIVNAAPAREDTSPSPNIPYREHHRPLPSGHPPIGHCSEKVTELQRKAESERLKRLSAEGERLKAEAKIKEAEQKLRDIEKENERMRDQLTWERVQSQRERDILYHNERERQRRLQQQDQEDEQRRLRPASRAEATAVPTSRPQTSTARPVVLVADGARGLGQQRQSQLDRGRQVINNAIQQTQGGAAPAAAPAEDRRERMYERSGAGNAQRRARRNSFSGHERVIYDDDYARGGRRR